MAQERRHQHSQRVVQLQPAARPPQARQGSLPPSPAPEGTRCGQACLWARAALQAGGERSHSLHGTDCCIKRVPHATGFQEAARPHTQGRAGQAPRGPDGARGHRPAEGAVAKQASAPLPETPGKVPPAPAAQRPGGGAPRRPREPGLRGTPAGPAAGRQTGPGEAPRGGQRPPPAPPPRRRRRQSPKGRGRPGPGPGRPTQEGRRGAWPGPARVGGPRPSPIPSTYLRASRSPSQCAGAAGRAAHALRGGLRRAVLAPPAKRGGEGAEGAVSAGPRRLPVPRAAPVPDGRRGGQGQRRGDSSPGRTELASP